jgi:hypothetical protein
MDGACGSNVGGEKRMQHFVWKPEGKRLVRCTGVIGGRIILKLILGK